MSSEKIGKKEKKKERKMLIKFHMIIIVMITSQLIYQANRHFPGKVLKINSRKMENLNRINLLKVEGLKILQKINIKGIT